MLALGVSYQMDPRWKLLADVKWTRWEVFKDITIVASDNNTVINSLPQNYEKYVDGRGRRRIQAQTTPFTLRGGVQYDQTPTNDIESFDPRAGRRPFLDLGRCELEFERQLHRRSQLRAHLREERGRERDAVLL